jgi:cysteine-rich repeat protein
MWTTSTKHPRRRAVIAAALIACAAAAACEDPEDLPCCEGEVCDNGVDDDGDTYVDCDDPECAELSECLPGDELCGNGDDDDRDGLADCDDPDCEGHASCAAPELCDNGLDEDLDGFVDCDDADCAGDPACPGVAEICDDGDDDDGDGLVDCLDPDCDTAAACAETCNGLDDDGDGQVDEVPGDATIGDACYEGPDAVAGVGQCVEGRVECFGGELLCAGWVAPADAELCDGLDSDCDGEIPAEELAIGCSPYLRPGEVSRIELQTALRDVDVHFNLDTTGSMYGELDTLRTSLTTTIVPGIREALPTAELGVSTFDDFPVGDFGAGSDRPFILHQRVTSNVPLVQAALDAIEIHGGNDDPESGVEALYQIATGVGTSWPQQARCLPGEPGRAPATVSTLEDEADVDAFSLALAAGQTLEVGVWAAAGADPYALAVELRGQASGDGWLAGLNSCPVAGGSYVAAADQGVVVVVRAAWIESPPYWYAMTVTVDGEPYAAAVDGCAALEVGGDPFAAGAFEPALAVPLVAAAGVLPRADAASCRDDCATAIGAAEAEPWFVTACGGAPAGDCGDGEVQAGEECDDGNGATGDGCDGCALEDHVVPAFDWEQGFDSGLGHGAIGGAGFRETALPVIVHITDAPSHESTDYTPLGIAAHSSAEAFYALGSIGARVVAVRSGAYSDDPTDLLYPLGIVTATNALVPVCAFDGSAARASGACEPGLCCTSIGGAGVAPTADGLCPLAFEIDADGSGLDESIVNAIDVLTQFVRYELTAAPRDDPGDDVDALCFVEAVSILDFEGPPGACVVEPTPTDEDGDGVLETLRDATPRTRVTFEITAVNSDVNDVDHDGDASEACAASGTYGLFLDVVAEGGTVVASRRLEVEVP